LRIASAIIRPLQRSSSAKRSLPTICFAVCFFFIRLPILTSQRECYSNTHSGFVYEVQITPALQVVIPASQELATIEFHAYNAAVNKLFGCPSY